MLILTSCDFLVTELLHPAVARRPDQISESLTYETLRSSLPPQSVDEDRRLKPTRSLGKIECFNESSGCISPTPVTRRIATAPLLTDQGL
jgi:hypothetical protein